MKKTSKFIIIAAIIVVLSVSAVLTVALLHNKADVSDGTTQVSETEPAETEPVRGTELTTVENETTEEVKNSGLIIGNYYTFGKYEQNNNLSDGKEDIKWLILDKQDDKVLLVSEYALDCKKYNEKYADVTWETCSLRKWLNDNFLKSSFSEQEQSQIALTTLENKANSETNTPGGNNTDDKIFLLSEEEYNKYSENGLLYICDPTDYAVANGGFISDGSGEDGAANKGSTMWWLRTPGFYQSSAMLIITDGLKKDGAPVNSIWVENDDEEIELGYTVRPAMWVTVG